MLARTALAVACVSLILAGQSAALGDAGVDDDSASSATASAQRNKNGSDAELKAHDTVTTPKSKVTGAVSSGSECRWQGDKVPCDYAGGWWSSMDACYVFVVSSDPKDGDPAWGDHEDGYLARCQKPGSDGATLSNWRASLPPKDPPPAVLAKQATESMGITKMRIGVTPKNGGIGLVGLPVWMWVDNLTQNTYTTKDQPLTKTATAIVTSVTGRGYVEKIVWDMGDGNTVTCTNPGTVYDKSLGSQPSPTCPYKYTRSSANQPNNRYQIAATTYWTVDWEETSGGGQSGQIQLQLESSTTRRVGELQVLVH